MSPRIAHLQLLAAYNRWMNERVYASAARLDAEELARDRGAFFGSILGTLHHLVLTDTMWLKRFANHPRAWTELAPVRELPMPTAQDAKQVPTLDGLAPRRVELDAWIESWIPRIGDEHLDGLLRYTNTKGQEYSRNFHGLLSHFFNHQTHHRGQVTTLLTQAGVDVGATDLLLLVPEQAQ